MKPARVRPLSQAYHQLAALLHETLLCLYTSDTLPKLEDSLQKAEAVLSSYESQMAKEEEMFFGFLFDYDPFITAILLGDYKECMSHIRSLRKKIAVSNTNKNRVTGNVFKHRIVYGFNEFLNCCEKQMRYHESLINPLLWRYFSDDELEQMASAFIIKQSPFLHRNTAVTETSAFTIAV